MAQDENKPIILGEILTDDLYIRHLVSIANHTSRLYDELEKVLNIEEALEGTAFLDTLTKLEAWCDGAATRHDGRLKFTSLLKVREAHSETQE